LKTAWITVPAVFSLPERFPVPPPVAGALQTFLDFHWQLFPPYRFQVFPQWSSFLSVPLHHPYFSHRTFQGFLIETLAVLNPSPLRLFLFPHIFPFLFSVISGSFLRLASIVLPHCSPLACRCCSTPPRQVWLPAKGPFPPPRTLQNSLLMRRIVSYSAAPPRGQAALNILQTQSFLPMFLLACEVSNPSLLGSRHLLFVLLSMSCLFQTVFG